jgi:hypothetical protein
MKKKKKKRKERKKEKRELIEAMAPATGSAQGPQA